LKASIARDLIQGQGEHTATRELLKQYAPLEGVITSPAGGKSPRSSPTPPVEKTLAHNATVAPERDSPWHTATEAQPATVGSDVTVARLATVKGELRVPNIINFSLFPTLDPFAKAVYYQLYLLSHGFRRDTCVVGLAKLAKSVLMSQRKVQDTILYLEKRGLIRRLRAILGGPSKGNVYQVLLRAAEMAPDGAMAASASLAGVATPALPAAVGPEATLAPHATNKDDDDIKIQSSSKGHQRIAPVNCLENHSRAAAPREKAKTDERDLALVCAAYEKATGNRWNKSDTVAYEENHLGRVPAAKIVSILEAVTRRTPTKINSLKYFVKEILALPDGRNRAWQKKQLEKIIVRVRDCSIGRAEYSSADFREDVKCACVQEGVVFNDDIYNELVG
jgi:hypothetical protein